MLRESSYHWSLVIIIIMGVAMKLLLLIMTGWILKFVGRLPSLGHRRL